MSHTLAILAPTIGGRSETFIRRHMAGLLPDRTVVVAETDDGVYGGQWQVPCPQLLLAKMRSGGVCRRVVDGVARRLGRSREPRVVAVARFLRKYRVRVAMGEYLDWSLPWLPLARAAGIRFLAHAHGYDVSMQLREGDWPARYLAYNDSDGVITMSERSRSRLIDLGLTPDKVHVVPYGVDVASAPIIRPDRGAVGCLAVGRMVAKKAPLLTLEAFRRAAVECPRLRLDYIGDGDLLPSARKFVSAFNLHDRVRLLGAHPSEAVKQAMANADIFVQHSRTDPETGDEEGLPVAILEAMASALPVVSTRHAGIPEAVVDGVTGLLVDEGDTAAMADRLLALARDRELCRRLGHAGWQRARDRYSWTRERAELLRVLGLEAEASTAEICSQRRRCR